MDNDAAFASALAFMHAVEERSCTHVEQWLLGRAFLHDRYPLKWVLNFMRVEKEDTSVRPERVTAEADRVLGGAGLHHRMVHVVGEEMANHLQPLFEASGWETERLLVMVHGGPMPATRHAPGVQVRAVEAETVRPYIYASFREEWSGISHEDAEQITASRAATEAAVRLRDVGGYLNGDLVGRCELYDGGHIGQIEDVSTLDQARRRGIARAMVAHALHMSRELGHDLTFLVADDADWPKDFYGRLGFESVGRIHEFRRSPPGVVAP